MILATIQPAETTVETEQEAFLALTKERYGPYLQTGFEPMGEPKAFVSLLKPVNASVCPYLVLDYFIHNRRQPASIAFVHDISTFGMSGGLAPAHDVRPDFELALRVAQSQDAKKPTLQFKGFGHRMDIAFNALALLYVDILGSLTRVEAEVLSHLRELQFSRENSPSVLRTYGLQKVIAKRLDKSPVAIHKSLRSSKFQLLSDTANAMNQMIS